jgi:hypothetical protein
MNLVIKNVNIHQDAEGRFSLNDLHVAAGKEERHLPKFFLANQQTQDLITEIASSTDGGIPPSPLSVKKGGHGQGSYGCRELVYAYAMWISPKFHLEVIRTFDAVATGSYTAPKAARHLTRSQVAAGILLLRSAAEDLRFAPSAVLGGYQRLEAQLGVDGLLPAYTIDAPGASGSSEVAKPVSQLLTDFDVEMSAVAFNRLLVEAGLLMEVERKSTHGTKTFKSVTDLNYGKNVTHPNNPKETQPMWYASRFEDVLALVMPEEVAA